METFKKTEIIALMTIISIIIIASAAIGVSVFKTSYETETIDSSSSPDGNYVLFLQKVGEPKAEAWSLPGQLVLKRNNKTQAKVSFETANDGGLFDGNDWSVIWLDDRAEVTLAIDEKTFEQIIMFYDGRTERSRFLAPVNEKEEETPEPSKENEELPSDNERKTLAVLAVGNSFTYSTLGYVPEIIRAAAPDVDLTFGIIYDSGFAIDQHIDYFRNDTLHTAVEIYTSSDGCYTRHTEENGNQMTTKEVLSRYKWDYIVLQEKPNRVYNTMNNVVEINGQLNTYHSRIVEFCEMISGYISGLDDPYSFSFLYNISQAYGANDPDLSVYSGANNEERSDDMALMHCKYAEMLMNNAPYMSYILDVLPTGTAVQNIRRFPEIASLGDFGYLCCDDISHLQSGIGVLTAGYAAAYKLLSLTGEPVRYFEVSFYPTDSWQLEYYRRSLHGNCVGINPQNLLTAQRCALAAVKRPFEITDLR